MPRRAFLEERRGNYKRILRMGRGGAENRKSDPRRRGGNFARYVAAGCVCVCVCAWVLVGVW